MTTDGLVPYLPELAARYRAEGCWGDETMATALHRAAATHADRLALVTTERRLTYGELDARSDAVAAGLLELGLRPGDAVTLQVDNTAETVELWYGLLKAGVVPVCTLSRHRHHEIDEIARLTGARGHVVQGDLPRFDGPAFAREVAERVPSVTHLLTTRAGDEPDLTRVEDLGRDIDGATARARVEAVQAELSVDAAAVYQLSGGTTARPKVIPRRHHEYLYNARARVERWSITDDDVLSYAFPLVHNAGIQTTLHLAHLHGLPLVLAEPDPDVFLPLYIQEGVTRALLPSGFAAALADHPDFEEMVRGLRAVVFSLGQVPPSVFDRVTALGATVVHDFGMGEGLIMTSALDDPEQARRLTVGRPLSPSDEVQLRGPDGREVAPGEPGELHVRGPYTIPGYLNEPERNAEVFDDESFYATGDVMVAHEIDGHTHYAVADRTKDLINRGGEKINSAEVEMLLLEHPRIREAALVAMPDDRLGERPCAFVVTDGEPPSVEELREFLGRIGVARFKCPERVETVDELPRTPVGKIAKNQLRDRVAALATPAGTTEG